MTPHELDRLRRIIEVAERQQSLIDSADHVIASIDCHKTGTMTRPMSHDLAARFFAVVDQDVGLDMLHSMAARVKSDAEITLEYLSSYTQFPEKAEGEATAEPEIGLPALADDPL